MKKCIITLSLILFLVFIPTQIFAESKYVLPYPSTMPGTMWYKVHLVLEELHNCWHFGNFGQFIYNLKESDKYLVEAKTLFEYKQYLLGYKALIKSNQYFVKAPGYLSKASLEGINVIEKKAILKSASERHQEVLEIIMKDLPKNVTWMPEKEAAINIPMNQAVKTAIALRKQI